MGEILLECKHLKKYFDVPNGKLHAVDDVSFALEKGKTLGVVGESGCGKSTLGRTILRLLPHTSGEVIFEGQDILKYNDKELVALRKSMQIIFQDPFSSLNPRYTVFDTIQEPLKIHKVYRSKADLYKKVRELMDTVGLAARYENAYPHELDGGRRQRIGIARALALNPKFIVCDEPVSALDVSIQAQVLNLMMDLQKSLGLTYMFITHDISVVKHISDEIAVMYLGQVVEKAKCDDLFDKPMHPYTKALLSAVPVADIKSRGVEAETIKGELTSPVNPQPGCRFAPRCPYATEQCRTVNLELRELEPDHFVACHLV